MESFGKVQEESIQKIENLFHVVLPEDYTKFLLDFNGGVIFNTEPGEVYQLGVNPPADIASGRIAEVRSRSMSCNCMTRTSQQECRGILELKDIAQFINIDVLYGIDTGKSECDIEYWTDKYFDDLLENTIIIGDSLQHGFIVMICVGENAGVYYYDDSYYFEESNDEGNVYWIAENFEEFWKMLKNY